MLFIALFVKTDSIHRVCRLISAIALPRLLSSTVAPVPQNAGRSWLVLLSWLYRLKKTMLQKLMLLLLTQLRLWP